MMRTPPVAGVHWRRTCRLVPSRYPTAGLFDRVASPHDLPELFELEGWTNDRLSNELGLLHVIPEDEWVAGPMASVVMAAFCHPPAGGARFSDGTRGAWYAGRTLDTALAESLHRRTNELAEIGVDETRVQMRLYHADFDASFHDLRDDNAEWAPLRDPDDHAPTQKLGKALLEGGSNGVVYPSARHDGGECLAAFRPRLAANVQIGGHFEYRWRGRDAPSVRRL